MKYNFLIVKSIFVPTDNYLKICVQSIINLFDYLYLSQIDKKDLTIMIIGWCNNKKHKLYEEIFNKLLEKYDYKIIFVPWKLNFGKIKILNYTFDYIRNHTIDMYCGMFYFDHDILFDLNLSSFITDVLKISSNQKINDKTIGLFSYNQTHDCRHQTTIYENTIYLNVNHNDNEKIVGVYPDQNLISSIASGAFYITYDAIVELDELPLISVYTMDDYILIDKLNKKQYLSVVLRDYSVIHPYDICDEDLSYKEWKYNMIINFINDNENNYYKTLENSINFWNKY